MTITAARLNLRRTIRKGLARTLLNAACLTWASWEADTKRFRTSRWARVHIRLRKMSRVWLTWASLAVAKAHMLQNLRRWRLVIDRRLLLRGIRTWASAATSVSAERNLFSQGASACPQCLRKRIPEAFKAWVRYDGKTFKMRTVMRLKMRVGRYQLFHITSNAFHDWADVVDDMHTGRTKVRKAIRSFRLRRVIVVFTIWLRQTLESGLQRGLLQQGLDHHLSRKQSDAWQSWRLITARTTVYDLLLVRGILHEHQRATYAAFDRWYRRTPVSAMQRLAEYYDGWRRLWGGWKHWIGFRVLVVQNVIRLGSFAMVAYRQELMYTIRAWQAYAWEARSAMQHLKWCRSVLINRELTLAWRNWLILIVENGEAHQRRRKYAFFFVMRRLTFGFAAWKHSTIVHKRFTLRDPMPRVLRFLWMTWLGRGWLKWRELVHDAHTQPDLMERGRQEGRHRELTRVWAEWVDFSVYERVLRWTRDRSIEITTHRLLSSGFAAWLALMSGRAEKRASMRLSDTFVVSRCEEVAFTAWVERMREERHWEERSRRMRRASALVHLRSLSDSFRCWRSHWETIIDNFDDLDTAAEHLFSRRLVVSWRAWLRLTVARIAGVRRFSMGNYYMTTKGLTIGFNAWVSFLREAGVESERRCRASGW